jgi:hypothetical protein
VIDVEDRPAALGELTRQPAEANVNVDLHGAAVNA